MSVDFATLLQKTDHILSAPSPREARLKAICYLLRNQVPHYDWVGFYLADPDEDRMLVLGPYEGEPTDHVRIPFGKGICGRVAESGKTLVIQDVSGEENYLSCSIDVRSEIVVPIHRNGRFVAQLDIDSHALAPFTDEDRLFLDRVCDAVATLF